jgi:hypothetical protein
VLAGCRVPDVSPPAAVVPRAGVHVAFDSFVNVRYDQGRSLPGLQTTRTVIETTLKQWYDRVDVRQSVTDGTPADLRRFLSALPGPQECEISIVYLGSIQNASAGWEFANGQTASWDDLLADPDIPAHPCRIVILDSCYAAAVRTIPAWTKRFGTISLPASGPDERTYQMEPSALRPLDVQKHYPDAWGWAKHYLPPVWQKHVSFLGLMWIQTVNQTASPPAGTSDWAAFFSDCSNNAELFRRDISGRWGSSMQPF